MGFKIKELHKIIAALPVLLMKTRYLKIPCPFWHKPATEPALS